MWFEPKLPSTLWRTCYRGIVLLLLVVASLPARAETAHSLPWKTGLIEDNTFDILREGVQDGRIEQRLFGLMEGNRRCYRVTYDMVRKAYQVGESDIVGRTTIEIVFDAATFDMIRREDHYAVHDTEGRAQSERTPTGGVRVKGQSAAQGLDQPTVDQEIEFRGAGPLLEQLTVPFLVRSLPDREGEKFELSTVTPLQLQTDHLRGRVGALEKLTWQGSEVTVRRIEISSEKGTTTYLVRPADHRPMLRFVSPDGEIYELRPPAKP